MIYRLKNNFVGLKGFVFTCLSVLIFSSYLLQAQIVVNNSKGCVPFEVEFKHNFGNVTNPKWEFGNGSISNINFPKHNYVDKGVYTVKFAADGGISSTIEITALGSPVSNFEFVGESRGCKPLKVEFKDISSGDGNAKIIKYEWDFGDGGIDKINPNPSYTYTLKGVFDVSLVVTDENGCTSSKDVPDLIVSSVPPNVSFTTDPNPPTGCTPPVNISFNSTSASNSPATGGLSYSWDFGNGSFSNLKTPPKQTYNNLGQFVAKLIVTDDAYCSDSTNKMVTLQSPKAIFEVVDAISDTVCRFVEFKNFSEGASSTFISFGDGSTGIFNEDSLASHKYKPGTYEVEVKAISGNCHDIVKKTIVIMPLFAGYDVEPTLTCENPFQAKYTNLSKGDIISWEWIFGDGQSSTEKDPPIMTHYLRRDSFIHKVDFGALFTKFIVGDKYGCISYAQIPTVITMFSNIQVYAR